jgi:hypothetical protein
LKTIKSINALIVFLLFSVGAFSWNSDTTIYGDSIIKPQTQNPVNTKGFVVFNKANFSVVKATFIVKGMQIVAVLEPKKVTAETAPHKNTISICRKPIKVEANAYAKYAKTKVKTPTVAKHQTNLRSLQVENTGFATLFDSFNDKISLNYKTEPFKKSISEKNNPLTLAVLFSIHKGKIFKLKCSKSINPFVTATFFYGSSAFANRPPPAGTC